MRLNIIRHGMTEANERHLYCGFTDIPLSKLGRQSLTRLKETIIYPTADLYITSGLIRASETLSILYDREPDVVMEEFKEFNFGDFEMKSYDELKDKAEYQHWINDGSVRCPNGESRDIFENRVMAGLNKLSVMIEAKLQSDTWHESAVVVCHGGVIALIMERLFPDQKNFHDWQPDFGRGYTLNISSERNPELLLL